MTVQWKLERFLQVRGTEKSQKRKENLGKKQVNPREHRGQQGSVIVQQNPSNTEIGQHKAWREDRIIRLSQKRREKWVLGRVVTNCHHGFIDLGHTATELTK